jgi:PKD repeat protein
MIPSNPDIALFERVTVGVSHPVLGGSYGGGFLPGSDYHESQVQGFYHDVSNPQHCSSVPYDLRGDGIKDEPPVAKFTYSPENPKVNQNITFNASSSYDPDGDVLNWHWDFGDGYFSEGEVGYHSYTDTGEYIVSLTVTDNYGLTNSYELDVEVDPQPTKKALLIGCWDYPGYEKDLISGILNLHNMENLLLSYQFENQNITILNNPTKSQIKGAINTFESNQGDINFLYMHGHGFQDLYTKNETFVASDASFYRDYELENDLSGFNNISIIFDSCNSGGLCESTDESLDLGGIEGDSKVVLMASGSEENSFLSDTGSVFTTAFYKAFYLGENMDRVSVEDAFYSALVDVLMKLSNQHPVMYDAWLTESNNDDEFYLSSNPPKSYKSLSTKCPVHLHCYDTQNNHVGINEDGSIDLNISNVGYSGPWYEDEFLVISANDAVDSYRIVVDAYDDGFFTLECHDFNQETTETSTILYQNIPITSATTASILINGNIFGDLLIDDDEDDIPDRIISPTIYPERIFTPNALFYYNPESPEKNQEICFNASSSYDEDGDIIDYTWDFGDGTTGNGEIITHSYPTLGEYSIKLSVTDNDGLTTITQMKIELTADGTILDITPPTSSLTIGEPKFGTTPTYVSPSTTFTLSATDDLSGVDKTNYRLWYNSIWIDWMEYTGSFISTDEGTHYLEYYSIDIAGNVEETHNQTYYVDGTPPVVTISASPNSLWPPNNKMKNVLISGSATDAGSGIASLVFSVEDEYDLVEPTLTSFGQTIQLQAMRYGYDFDGRMYTITATATDNLGHVTTASTIVRVPHDQGN